MTKASFLSMYIVIVFLCLLYIKKLIGNTPQDSEFYQ